MLKQVIPILCSLLHNSKNRMELKHMHFLFRRVATQPNSAHVYPEAGPIEFDVLFQAPHLRHDFEITWTGQKVLPVGLCSCTSPQLNWVATTMHVRYPLAGVTLAHYLSTHSWTRCLSSATSHRKVLLFCKHCAQIRPKLISFEDVGAQAKALQ